MLGGRISAPEGGLLGDGGLVGGRPSNSWRSSRALFDGDGPDDATALPGGGPRGARRGCPSGVPCSRPVSHRDVHGALTDAIKSQSGSARSLDGSAAGELLAVAYHTWTALLEYDDIDGGANGEPGKGSQENQGGSRRRTLMSTRGGFALPLQFGRIGACVASLTQSQR